MTLGVLEDNLVNLAMSARVLCHMDANDTIIYVSQKAQTVPGHGKATPV